MKPPRLPTILIAAVAMLAPAVSHATKLRVEPVLVELTAPAAASVITLRNDEDFEITVQTRVMAWRQSNGEETLQPTTDVVASPPSIRLAPGANYIVRVVRVSQRPIRGEESYRLLIDQLPNIRSQQARTVNLLIRQSIPAFFRAPQLSRSNVSWSYSRRGEGLTITATNSGDERLRIAGLNLRDSAGRSMSLGSGLIGYVLGRSTMSWQLPRVPRGFGDSGTLSVSAQTDKLPVNAVARMSLRP